MAFLLNADEKVYGRYGGRDARSAEGRLSLARPRDALRAALDAHRRDKDPAPARPARPLLVEDYPAARRVRPGTCIHCHQVNEFRRQQEKAEGKWSKDAVWRYPL